MTTLFQPLKGWRDFGVELCVPPRGRTEDPSFSLKLVEGPKRPLRGHGAGETCRWVLERWKAVAELPLSGAEWGKNHLEVTSSSMAGQREMFPRTTCRLYAGVLPGVIQGLHLRAHRGAPPRQEVRKLSKSTKPEVGSEGPHLCRPPLQTAIAQLQPPPATRQETGLLPPRATLSQPNPEVVRNGLGFQPEVGPSSERGDIQN